MAGHSQFKNIMYRKGAQDKRRSRIFSRLSREITVAAKLGGSDISGNPRLRLAVQNARAQNMPRENINRSIARATAADGGNFEELRYEGYGPGGVGVIVEALSDNRNRTASAVRAGFSKFGGNLADQGAVAFLFDHVGEIVIRDTSRSSAEHVLGVAVESGAEDVSSANGHHLVYCAPEVLQQVAGEVGEQCGEPESARIIWRPNTLVPIDGKPAETLLKMIAGLEEQDDVQQVFANFDIPEALLASTDA